MKPVRCPCCRLRIDGSHVWFLRRCAACNARFRIRGLYVVTLYIPALVASVGIAFAIGNRGRALFALVSLLLLPTFWGTLMLNLRLFPVDIVVERQGWTPGDSVEDQELERQFELLRELDPVLSWENPEMPASMLDASTDDAAGPMPLSTPRDSPVTLEGIVIAVAVAALLAATFYMAIEPHIQGL